MVREAAAAKDVRCTAAPTPAISDVFKNCLRDADFIFHPDSSPEVSYSQWKTKNRL
jgi:hypothetical protein